MSGFVVRLKEEFLKALGAAACFFIAFQIITTAEGLMLGQNVFTLAIMTAAATRARLVGKAIAIVDGPAPVSAHGL